MCVGSITAGTLSSSQSRPDNEFETDKRRTPIKKLIIRYAHRMLIENALSDAVRFFHMDALSSTVGLKVDLWRCWCGQRALPPARPAHAGLWRRPGPSHLSRSR